MNSQTPFKINSIANIINDMKPPHESIPHGVPNNIDWVRGPRLSMGNNPRNFRAITAWGQLYECARKNPARNTRVQIRNMKTYILSQRDKKWHLLQYSRGVGGAAYREDYKENINKPANVRQEKDGSISALAGNGYNYHFWIQGGRAWINPQDIAGVFTTVQARLVVDNPRKLDDRRKARYLLSVGADYWLNLTAQWDNFKTNADVGIGKFKYVRRHWQAFNMTTLSPSEIRRNPPPID